jgi:hypothetical protein
MSGSGAQKRKQALARQVYNLSQQGLTHRQIAEVVGLRDNQISIYVALGERLVSVQPSADMNNSRGVPHK